MAHLTFFIEVISFEGIDRALPKNKFNFPRNLRPAASQYLNTASNNNMIKSKPP
jgi:hypothetical protein